MLQVPILPPSYEYFFHSKKYDFSSNKDISFLMVSRERFVLIEKSINNVFSFAMYKDRIEVLLWLDDDDVETIKSVESSSIINQYNVKIYIGKRRGWDGLHFCREELARKAMGKVFFLWTEEFMMMDRNWDCPIYEFADRVAIFDNELYLVSSDGETKKSGDRCRIPCLTRRTYDIIGRLSGPPLSDVSLDYIAGRAGICVSGKVRVSMFIEDPLHCESYTSDHFYNIMEPEIDKDVDKIRFYMEKYAIKHTDVPYLFIGSEYTFWCDLSGGKKGDVFNIVFIDESTGENVYETNVESYTVSRVLRDWYVPWHIQVRRSNGDVIHNYHYSAYNKNIFIKIDEKSSIEDVFLWSYYIDKFREKYGCNITCSSPFSNFLKIKFEKITYMDVNYKNKDISVCYRVGRFEGVPDIFIHKEDYRNIPSGKIASNILGIEYENNDREIINRFFGATNNV